MAVTPDGGGYWLSNTAGQVFPFGNAPYYGDTYPRPLGARSRVAATAPKLRPVVFAGTVLYLKPCRERRGRTVPHAVPRLDGG